MNAFETFCLQQHRKAFVLDLRPKYILKNLIKDGIITLDEKNLILLQESSKEKVTKLFDILICKQNAFSCFIQALNSDNAYPWLADKLSESAYITEEVSEKLVEGGIPFETNHLLYRIEDLIGIRQSLKEAAIKRRYWIFIHGMTGNGKSVLASEAVRDNSIVKNYFNKGVFWIQIGKVNDDTSLLLKMDSLYKKLIGDKECDINDNSYNVSEGIKKINHLLKKEIFKREYKILLILDDVWSAEVIKAFDVGCPIMVTGKIRAIFDNYSSFCDYIEAKGLDFNESKELIAKYAKCLPADLPYEALRTIHDKCKGSPMLLSGIGGKISSFGSEDPKIYLCNMSEEIEDSIAKTLRTRHSSQDLVEEFKKIIQMLLGSLEDIKEYFFDLSVFPEDVAIPCAVLEIFWNKNEIKVKEIMDDMYQSSLGIEKIPQKQGHFAYNIHDLYLEVLKGLCENEKQRHSKLVQAYLKKIEDNGNYNFSLLSDDNYIYYYFAYHLYKSDNLNLMKEIFLNLDFIRNKLHFAGPYDLLSDYENYSKCFQGVEKELNEYKDFVRKNASNIIDNDIIQLALFEPKESTIYNKAKAMASRTNKLYFEWCNDKEKSPFSNYLCSKSSTEEIKYAVLSPDGFIVATICQKPIILIWSAISNEDLENLIGHNEAINYCAFDSTGRQLVTASADKTLKIFEINVNQEQTKRFYKGKRNSLPSIEDKDNFIDKSILTFSLHEDEVICCAFSPDNSLIISSDQSGIVYVWESCTGICKREVSQKSYQANFCCFDNSGDYFAAAFGGNIHLWGIKSEDSKIFSHDDMLVSKFCFMADADTSDRMCLISASDNISQWDFNGKRKILISNLKFSITCCCLSPDKNYFVYGTSNSFIYIMNLNSKKIVAHLRGHSDSINNVIFSNDGEKLFSVSSHHHIIYDMKNIPDVSIRNADRNLSVHFRENELFIALSNYQNCIEIRKGYEGESICEIPPENEDITACALSYDCTEVIYGTQSGQVKVFNINNDNKVPYVISLIPHAKQITYLSYKPNDHLFFSCSEDKTIMVWKNKNSPLSLRGHTETVIMCIPFHTKEELLSCSSDGTLRVWDINTGELCMRIDGHGNQTITHCDISPDESLLASASSDGYIKVWNSKNGEIKYEFENLHSVRCCRFSPNGEILISGDDEGNIHLWNLNKKFANKILGSHTSWINDIIFSQTGSHFITVSDDIKIWDERGKYLQKLMLPGVSKCSLWINNDFTVIVAIHNSLLYILKKI